MEYCHNGSLGDFIRQGNPIDETTMRRYTLQVMNDFSTTPSFDVFLICLALETVLVHFYLSFILFSIIL